MCREDLQSDLQAEFVRIDTGKAAHGTIIERSCEAELCQGCAPKLRAAVRALGIAWPEPTE